MKIKKLNRKLLNIILLVLVVLFSSIAGVYAERIIASSKVTYSNGTSGLSSANVQSAIDELYRKCIRNGGCGATFARALQASEASDTVMLDDGTTDHNMRFTGKSPNNYVTFEGEEWRVIGVFNNIDNGAGVKESRVKIIKSSSLGNKPWNSNNVNVWKSATLNTELQASVYALNSLIDNAVWHLGDPGSGYKYTTPQAYEYERGTSVASGNDPTWTGKVGLMYPSDYGFASSGCKDGSNQLSAYNNATCTETNWLFLGSVEWLLSPQPMNTTGTRNIALSGYVAYYTGVGGSYTVRPTVYLKSSVICKNCNEATAGTKDNPFQIG